MKTKKKKYLKMYEEWMITGLPHGNGLCNEIGNDKLFNELVYLTWEERMDLRHTNEYLAYWASGYTPSEYSKSDENRKMARKSFTPLRQNILLLLAAVNKEL